MTIRDHLGVACRAAAWSEVSPDALVAIDATGAVLWGNPAAEALFGWELTEAQGMNAFQLVHPDDLWEASDSLRTTLERPGVPGTLITVRLRRADDRYLSCEVRGVSHIDAPEIGAVILAVREVTDRKQLADQIEESQRRFEAVARHASEVILLLDVNRSVQWVSPALTPATGWRVDEVLNRPILELVHPDDQDRARADVASIDGAPGATAAVEVRMRHRDGEWRRCEVLFVNMLDDPDVGRIATFVRDESETTREKTRRLAADERFRSAFENAPIGMAVQSLDGRFQRVNATLCALLGYRRDQLESTTLESLTHPEDRDATSDHLAAAVGGELESHHFEQRLLRSDGRVVWVRFGLSVVSDGQGAPSYMIGQVEDITGRRRDEERLTYQALHDSLTGLPNRALLMDRLGQALERARAGGPLVAVLFCDLDRFKLVNDSLGHQAGDRLLVACGRRLRKILRATDTVARFGGDEFVILCTDVQDRAEVVEVARRIAGVLDEPFVLDATELHVSTSVGIAFSEDGAHGPVELLRDADAAMYQAKEEGRSRAVVFEPSMRSRIVERIRLEADLRRGIEADDLRIHLQPIVHRASGALVGAEALVRWQRGDRLVMPAEFVPLAEETGLIVAVGRWVLERVSRQLVQWRAANIGLPDAFRMMVNLSPRELDSREFVSAVQSTFERNDVAPGRVCFELTESALADDSGWALDSLRDLRALGCGLAIDDFGTGYSALAHLRRFPFDTLKIDRTFVAGLGRDSHDDVIVGAVARIADALGLGVVAEGVETTEQHLALARHGVEVVQGFLFARPVPSDVFADLYLRGDRIVPTAAGS